MITRHYFYSFKWNHLDGTSSYTFEGGVITHKSLIPSALSVYRNARDEFITSMETNFKDGVFEAVSFNKI